jgi:hypothetical protein
LEAQNYSGTFSQTSIIQEMYDTSFDHSSFALKGFSQDFLLSKKSAKKVIAIDNFFGPER